MMVKCAADIFISMLFSGVWKFDNSLWGLRKENEGNDWVYWKIELMSIKCDPGEFRIFF